MDLRAALACAAALGLAAAPAARTNVYRHATLVDATAPEPRPGMALVVEDGLITQVVPDAEAPRGGASRDLKGRYVMPGIVDTHVHVATEPDLKVARAILTFMVTGGVTTVRDMAGDARTLAEIRRKLLVGEWTGPTLQFSALMAGPSFFVDKRTKASAMGETPGQVAWMAAITHDTDLPLAVAQAKGTYASGIKLYANLDASLAAAVVAEARRQAFPVWAHAALFPATPGEVAATGLTSMAHAPMFVYEVVPMPAERLTTRPKPDYRGVSPDDPRLQAVFRTMREKGVALDATMTVFRTPRSGTPEAKARAVEEYAFAVAITRAAHRAGVIVTTGTDYLRAAAKGEPAVWDEMIALQEEAGFTPAEVLKAATVDGAKVLGLGALQGTLAPGQRADFLVLRDNPLHSARAIRSLVLTVKGGRAVPRAGYRPSPLLKGE